MKNITIILSLLLLIIIGCGVEERTHAPELLGTWEPKYMILEDAGAASSDPMADVFVANPDNWVKVTGIKPIRITYAPDGTFTQEHRDRNDSLFLVSKGTWYTVGDSLHWFQHDPDTFRLTLQYRVALDTLRLYGIVDYDRDGERDDKYTGIQTLVK